MNNIYAPSANPIVPSAAPTAGEGFPVLALLPSLIRIAIRRRWVIAAVFAASVLVGLLVTVLATPLYTATVRIEIAREGARITNIRDVEQETTTADLEFYQTQYGLLKSRSLAEQIARALKLDQNHKFFEINKVRVPAEFWSQTSLAAANKRVTTAADVLLANVTIDPDRGSRLVNISYSSADPDLATAIANTWAQQFIQSTLARRFEATSYARKFLETRLEQLRVKLEESERRAVGYASQQGIINLPGTIDPTTGRTTGERSLAADELSHLSEELANATADRIRAGSQMQLHSQGSAPVNTTLTQLREKRAELSADYAKLMTQFSPEYPTAKSLASQIAALNHGIGSEEARDKQSLSDSYSASLNREQALRARVDTLKAALIDLRGRSIQYNIFQRDVDTNRELYNGLLQRYKEIGIAGGVGQNNISIVDDAQRPVIPSHPRPLINLLIAIIVGLALSAALVWLLEQLQEGIADPSDIPARLHIPILGSVPTSKELSPLTELQNLRSPLVEAYLAIQANLELATAHGMPKSIAVTSTRPKEGKSLTSYALAHSIARAKKRVALLDCDMRAPMVHHEFKLPNDSGVSNFLAGSDDLSRSMHPTQDPNLFIMTAGPLPPNAADLLTGNRLRMLIDKLLETYDHVVIDGPPVMGLADAALISSAVEAVVYAVQARVVRTSIIRIALQRILDTNSNVVGAVLTKFDEKHSRYGYGYDYGYGYGRSHEL